MEEIKRILEGNMRYLKNIPKEKDLKKQREKTKNIQKPFAVVLGCSDSRVPPEIIFDCGIGELFVIRNAGNIATSDAIASIEYAVNNLGVKLVIVLGHTDCNALKIAQEETKKINGNLGKLIKNIKKEIKCSNNRDIVKENIYTQIRKIKRKCYNFNKKMEEGVKIIGAIYNLEDGKVEILR